MKTHTSINSGLKARLFALIIDFIIMLLPVAFVVIGLLAAIKPSQSTSGIIVIFVPVLMYILYFTFTDYKGQSLGKKYVGLVINKTNNSDFSLVASFIRSLFKVLFGWICWINIPGSSSKLSFYDILLKTAVFYETNDNVLKNDNEKRRINFIKRFSIILPIMSLVVFIFIFLSKVALNSSLVTGSSIIRNMFALLIVVVFYTCTFGLTVSIQAIREKVFQENKGKLVAMGNGCLLVIFVIFFIKTLISM